MKIHLAPMEGVVDASVRELLTALGGIDQCVTEFIRVTDHPLPPKVFTRYCPELENHCTTSSGTPVKIQLLGGKPEPMAVNAAKAARLGAHTIDLNFGCPAKTVNKNDGGASLLKEPERVNQIVSAVRHAVPNTTPVTGKIRLGFHDRSGYLDNALAVAEGGASELVVHARSKVDGYKPPAYWETLADIRETLAKVTPNVNVVANGEIWTVEDWKQCRAESGCTDFMIGRGLMACPDLALQIKAYAANESIAAHSWQDICSLLHRFYSATTRLYPKKFTGNRLKQWLAYLRKQYPEAEQFFEQIKGTREPLIIEKYFSEQLS
ncbi:tRNA-dihydrouridine synthase [Marinibactrum halimedae]|uniref:tRNA-dihydrouridine(16) synthase n=1 Tax=Marinibactrum halimedae TaxID=1444977 RepID=A0AA37WNS9_9GAMM|nr:tRNA-dihydrouridine synthase [Marinibactrum halimedae]MCD9460068.1 tRNA-dihydrouridine synthase [Marinibactrum halimedae]GLS26466.1 tRNA-dihydrouridine(16) synthase [Marinibactrum halimedae]